MWFNPADIVLNEPLITVDDLHGYILPHGGTEFTGGLISHTLRFRPAKMFTKILILYYPASETFDAENAYYHEYYIPWKSLLMAFGEKEYIGYNVKDRKKIPAFTAADTLIVVSADFTHFLPMNEALTLENKAAHKLMFRQVQEDLPEVDEMQTFRIFYDLIPAEWILQWIGRSRSSGAKAVGYLSFLVTGTPRQPHGDTPSAPQGTPSAPSPRNRRQLPDGLFVTAFSQTMTARECLGEWYDTKKWSPKSEQNLIEKVLRLGATTSRLTSGTELDVPLSHYTVTYLYKSSDTKFIRGWHGILHNAFFLPEVFLENTYENGAWIKPTDSEWLSNVRLAFDLKQTLQKLNTKANSMTSAGGMSSAGGLGKRKRTKRYKRKKRYIKRRSIKGGQRDYTLYTSKVMHYNILVDTYLDK
jgi:hypothetical protein